MTSADEGLRLLLDAWVPRQRWFGGKGTHGELTLSGRIELGESPSGATLFIQLITTRADTGETATYQVPLSTRPAAAGDGEPGVGTLPDGTAVWDGPRDPEFVRAWLALLQSEGTAGETPAPTAHGRRQPRGVPVDPAGAARVLSGEQSNTSVIVGGEQPVIAKLFRRLHAGANPDVVVQSALASHGSRRVPEPAGWIEGTWLGPSGEPVSGHLAFASEFLTDTRDAWREACTALAAGESFADAAEGLGVATAEVHASMADAFGRESASPARRSQIMRLLRQRAAWACGQVAELADVRGRVALIHDELDSLTDLPALQRVHGDYHLGQVLDAPGRGWILLDFEGEPLRPISERSEPDLALRDVAGMLRSFDYAGHQPGPAGLSAADSEAWARQWTGECRDAFCAGYAAESGADPREQAALLVALELDKALYEVVYETRNRPDWVDVPLRAVARLTGS